MEQNPYHSPSTEPTDTDETNPQEYLWTLLALPLPFILCVLAWFAGILFFFQAPLLIPLLGWGFGAYWAVLLTSDLANKLDLGDWSRRAAIALHLFIILLAWPAGVTLYLALGFPEPMP